ncbi:MAG: (4Fe-4S)-binding protein [Microthrixaceae bacterium]
MVNARVLRVQRGLCVGNGQCVVEAPSVFSQDDDGTVTVVGDTTGHQTEIERAVEECPSGALSWDQAIDEEDGSE